MIIDSVSAPTILPAATEGTDQEKVNQFVEVDTDNRDDDPPDMWTIYIDGSSAKAGSGAEIVIKTPENTIIEQSVRFDFQATNNEAAYEALILGLKSLLKLNAEHIRVHTDSKLVACQMTGNFLAKSENVGAYRNLAISLAKQFKTLCIGQHPRATNSHADALATLAMAIPWEQRRTIQIKRIDRPSISGEIFAIYMADIGTTENNDKNWTVSFI
jgi:ribonuclease HI